MDSDFEPRNTRGNDSLRIIVPWKARYTEFVNIGPDTCFIDGFSVQVFRQAVFCMEQNSSPLRHQFVVRGTGSETMPYNEMLGMLTRKLWLLTQHRNFTSAFKLQCSMQEVDMLVGDLTIKKGRLQNVSFTAPYMAAQLTMVTPYRKSMAAITTKQTHLTSSLLSHLEFFVLMVTSEGNNITYGQLECDSFRARFMNSCKLFIWMFSSVCICFNLGFHRHMLFNVCLGNMRMISLKT
ncbi:hypothetical protein KP509_23G024500 [Ceratopteris richardii]|uniref:Uncharacterized protein n=1 Tax=Ceratopteris richardii TaxID=49495 RepID=A0A8T2S0P5_CERRI|nr:hypothetical protein KP509_23G024500 [Ceratopteris richardii]